MRRYFFAEYVQGRVWSIALTVDPMTGEATASDLQDHTEALGGTSTLGTISSFGVDADGELYIVAYTRGMIFKIASLPAPPRYEAVSRSGAGVSLRIRPSRRNGVTSTGRTTFGCCVDT